MIKLKRCGLSRKARGSDFTELKQEIRNLDDSMMASFKQIGETFIAFGDAVASKEDLEMRWLQ